MEACGGPQAYAALFAEARLRGEEKAFNAAFEGEPPEGEDPRRKKARLPASSGGGDGRSAVLGEHTAQVIEEQAETKGKGAPPRPGPALLMTAEAAAPLCPLDTSHSLHYDSSQPFTVCMELPMSARDFINDTLLPSLNEAIADEARGNKHYLRGFDDALKAITRFLEESRHQWDVPE